MATDGSFSRAARRLNISQPTLSQQIKSLEQRHGTPLFEGRRRPLLLTPTGSELLALTQRMFATADQIDDLLGNRPTGDAPTLRLASDSPAYAALLVQALLRSAPETGILVQIADSRRTFDQLIEARADVAILGDPQIDPRLAYRPLYLDRLQVLVPADHRLAHRAAYPLSAFAEDCLLIREPASKTRAAAETLLRAQEIEPRRTIEMHSREAIREAVALGLGIGLVFSAECPPDPRLIALEFECRRDAPLLTGYVVCGVEQRRSPLMRRVLQAAAALEPLSPVPLEPRGAGPARSEKAGADSAR